ncbi:hypothetical protein H6G97_09930 [Nostoc flagelliforme FACHB-838]|uniref:Transposase n=1 Tax=Nostoc flagelliforme FACHB-838 TaxID=2692904 RepID=A0ABR8DK83_9NOSO|nr:hypothetical protein [Nostoc flagelliforme FACHB-838]
MTARLAIYLEDKTGIKLTCKQVRRILQRFPLLCSTVFSLPLY